MLTIIDKIYNSRNNIKEIYDNYEWNTSEIPLHKKEELEQIFNTYNTSDSILQSIGDGMVFTLKIPHKYIENFNLVVLYYNLTNTSNKVSKINKSVVEKINKLYENEYIQNDDCILLLVNEKLSPSIDKINLMVNHTIKSNYNISSDKNKYIYDKDNPVDEELNRYNKNYFRNCIIIPLDIFQVNVLNHELVPLQQVIYDKKEIDKIYIKFNMNNTQMPIILKTDIISKIIRILPGDICKITRETKTYGDSIYYRYCK
tara:strand:+ start:1777 stop:2550 length:774 start_codon:yes stop_codon:yes gene_type:complete